MNKFSNLITTIVFLVIIFGLAIILFITPAAEKSDSENRNLTPFPEINITTLLQKNEDDAMTKFSNYITDHFPFRGSFREIKSWITDNIYNQEINNGYYDVEGHIGRLENEINEDSITHFTDTVNNVYSAYFSDCDNVFYTLVPDKGYYLSKKKGYPTINYDELFSLTRDGISKKIKYIDITDSLDLNDYYYTDVHWSCEKLEETVKVISDEMNFTDRLSFNYEIKELTDKFEGVYCKQMSTKERAEKINFITNPIIENLVVTVENTQVDGIYNSAYTEDINGYYSYFLYGSKGIVQIENPNADNDDELIIIRDSFGSSIAPWFVEAYSKITVLDLRYIFPSMTNKFINNNVNTDVLFLYSTSTVNDSSTIKN